MPTFQKVRLGDVAQEQRDTYTPSVLEDLPYIGLEHIEQQTLRLSGIGKSSDAMSQKKKFIAGDILYGSLRPYFRKVYKPKFNGVCSTDITVLKPKNNCSNAYLFYFIASPWFIAKASGAGTGTKMPRAGWKMVKDFMFDIPDLPTQTRIADVLSAYDDLIENNEKRIKVLEQMAQLLYTEWFVKFEFPISLCHPEAPAEGSQGYKSSGGKMLDTHTEYGKIPEGWEVKKLGDIVSAQYGYTASAVNNNACPKYLRGTDINKTSFIDWHYVPNCEISDADFKKYKVKKGGVFIIRMADPGKIGMCEREINAVFASYLMRLNIKGDITPYYLYYFVNSERYQKFILGASNGTTRKSINSQQVGAINIIIPPQDILNNFELRIGAFRETLNNLIQQNNFLSQTRDLLIPQLVTGKRELK